jgi:histidinol dehydrogenase
MKVYINPSAEEKAKIIQRPVINYASLSDTVTKILQQVKWKGDQAVKQFSLEFDKVQLTTLTVTPQEIETAANELSEELKTAIQTAANNIKKFHTAQKEEEKVIETMPGVLCKRRSVGIEKVGLYIPGGTAPLFSTVLMLGIPAKLAGCKRIILCTPPQKNGNIHPAVLFAASVAGIAEIFKVGGVQAIAAMAFGTETIPKVSKIFGPGNHNWCSNTEQRSICLQVRAKFVC